MGVGHKLFVIYLGGLKSSGEIGDGEDGTGHTNQTKMYSINPHRPDKMIRSLSLCRKRMDMDKVFVRP